MIHVTVVAPTLALRTGLRALLAAEADVVVVSEGPTLEDPEAILMDTDVLVALAEGITRQDLERTLQRATDYVSLLLLSDTGEDAQLLQGLPVRAWGLLPLDVSEEELVAAVRAIHAGLVVGTPPLLAAMVSKRLVIGEDEEPLPEPLTEREGEVLALLAQGLANKQIAGELDISEHTVKFHVSSIYSKLGAMNRAEAVRLGARRGLITL